MSIQFNWSTARPREARVNINERDVCADIVDDGWRGVDEDFVMFARHDILCVYSHPNSGRALICFLGGKVYGASHG